MHIAPTIYVHESDDPDLARCGWAAGTFGHKTVIWVAAGLGDTKKADAVQAALADLWPHHQIAV